MASTRPPAKRPSNDDSVESTSGSSRVKLPRIDRDPEDFSNVVKSKLQSYTRTGQACDRCKVRKIRCDALPQGCSHCANQNLECFVTDRVTGRTERRGYMQELEREKTEMLNHIRSLEEVLANNGIEVKTWQWSPYGSNYPPGVKFDAMGNPILSSHRRAKEEWTQVGSVWVRNQDPNQRQRPQSGPSSQMELLQQLEQFTTSYVSTSGLESRPGNSGHLGVGSDSSPLSAIKGTKLSILGTTIDITSFSAPEMDEPLVLQTPRAPLYNKSVQAFLQSAMRINPPLERVDLPPRNDAFEYSEWYFLMIFPFLPILHKPTYMNLLTRIYDDSAFTPTTSELVIVHMVFATIYFQYGVRNREDYEKQSRLNELSNKHYHWCLSNFFDIASDQTITAVQALLMLGNHMRSFPKPGCAYLVVQYTHTKAIELNLHRATRAALEGIVTLETEMRSRVWWCVLALGVTLNGRLGRPMPTVLSEFDVPFPLAIPDECLTPDGITDRSKIGQCSFQVGLAGHKIVPLYMEMYSNLYSVRRNPKRHTEVVARLEQQLRAWQEQLPAELLVENSKSSNTQVFALYAQAMALEFRICLRHPSVCTTTDPKFQAENTRICEETSRELLTHICTLLKLKSLDTTWYQLSVYVAAVFCTLVANWERRFHITPEEVARLREEMNMWLNIIHEIGTLLGSQIGLCSDISRIINHTIAWIEADMTRKLPNGASPAGRLQSQQHHSHTGAPTTNGSTTSDNFQRNGHDNFYETAASAYHMITGYGDQGSTVTTNNSGTASTTSYDPNDGVYNLYNAAAAVAALTGGGGGGAGGERRDPSAQVHIPSTSEGTPVMDHHGVGPLVAFPPGATEHVAQPQVAHSVTAAAAVPSAAIPAQPVDGDHWRGTGNPWNDWTTAIADPQAPQRANALLVLGNTGAGGSQVASLSQQPHEVHHHQQQQHHLHYQHHPQPHRDGAGGDGDGSFANAAASGGMADMAVAAAPGQQWPLLLFHNGAGAVT